MIRSQSPSSVFAVNRAEAICSSTLNSDSFFLSKTSQVRSSNFRSSLFFAVKIVASGRLVSVTEPERTIKSSSVASVQQSERTISRFRSDFTESRI